MPHMRYVAGTLSLLLFAGSAFVLFDKEAIEANDIVMRQSVHIKNGGTPDWLLKLKADASDEEMIRTPSEGWWI